MATDSPIQRVRQPTSGAGSLALTDEPAARPHRHTPNDVDFWPVRGWPPFCPNQDVVVVSTSRRYYVQEEMALAAIFASVDVAGTTATVLTIYRNGTSIGTVTIAIGAYTALVPFGVLFHPENGDYLTVAVTTAGAGALRLAVQPLDR